MHVESPIAREILDRLPNGVLVVGDGIVAFANAAFSVLTGWRREQITGRPLLDIVAEQDLLLHTLGFEVVFGEAVTHDVSVVFLRPDTSCQMLTVSAARPEDEPVTYLVVRDAAIIQNELAQTTRWAAQEQDRANEIARARDVLAKTYAELEATQRTLEQAFAQLQQEVAAREELERSLRLAQKLEAVGQLAAGVAHEINTPIQYMSDNINFIEKSWRRLVEYLDEVRGKLNDQHAEMADGLGVLATKFRVEYMRDQVPKALSATRDGAVRVSDIVRAMKAFAVADQVNKTYNDVNEALRNTLIVAQNEYASHALVETDLGDLPLVPCYIGSLNQVFLNLIVNAAQAIADAKRPSPGLIRISTRLMGEVVEVTIADNGCGIPAMFHHRVFDQFFTTKEVGRGTGTGLSVAHSVIVGAHGGTITFQSEVGVGTEFTIRLPVDGTRRL